MTWCEFASMVEQIDFAILPIGAIEEHGPHLPFGTDIYIGEYLAERLANATGGLLLHSLAYTPSFSLRLFPGTVRLSDETFVATLFEISESLYAHGIKTIYTLISHWGALAACKTAERRLLQTSLARIVNLALPGLNEAIEKFCRSKRWHPSYIHAEEFETSSMLAIRPDLVDMSKAVREYPEHDPLYGPISIPWSEFTESGVVGDATAADAETGRAILEHLFERSLTLIQKHQETLRLKDKE